ncbi:filament-forming protein tpr p270 protein [Pyrenophora tritici-repentis]|nr:TPR-MLP1-2 multi-domain protein [Pyrenophora tritici-repentis]KAI1555662.1 filament-forming protein tpr p270 protein [Pyrenophora tritici-repentis]PZD43225.1 filament-forming protein (tpr p270) protein [Pyrenophora tritici-repentis]
MAATAVDVGYLAASYAVPETTLRSLLSEPTVELVQSLLTQIEAKARAYDDLQSEKIRADVELEAAVQGGEQRARSLKATAEKAQKEAEELKKKLIQEENARQEAQTALQKLQATATSSTSETQALESRIKTLESHNRDAIAMHEAKTAAHDRLAKELSEQHQKSVELRKQVSALEEKTQSLESAATNVKFREANLQQEIEQLRNNNDWYTTELKTRADDHSKYRKEKNAQIAQLQRENADAAETIDTLRRSETLLRQHIEELKSKAEEDRLRIEELENEVSQSETKFHLELDSARRLATLHQQNHEMTKKRLEQLQADTERVQEDAANEIGQLQAEYEMERTKAAEAEARTVELETLVESLKSDNSDLRSSVRVPGTPRHGMNGGFSTPGRAGSPAVFSPGGSQLKADASKTQLLIENNDLKKELRRVREKHEEQNAVLNEMLQELESRQPEFEEIRRQNDALIEQNNEISSLLDDAISEREAAQKDSRKALGDLEGMQSENNLLQRQLGDLTIQLRSLMWRIEAEKNGLGSLPEDQQRFLITAVEKNEVADEFLPTDSPTQNMITQYLTLYNDIKTLQQQNSELLRTIRQVGDEQEKQESRMKSEQYQKDIEELGHLRSVVAEKDEEIQSLLVRSQTLKTERDMYSRIVGGRNQMPSHAQSTSAFAQSVPATGAPLQLENGNASREIPEYSKLIKDLQSHIDLLKEESATDRATLKSQVDGLTKDNTQLQSDKLRCESQLRREQDRYARLEGSIKLLQSEKDSLQERYNKVQATMAQQDDNLVKATQNAAEAEARLQSLQGEMVQLRASQQMSATIEVRLKERNQELMTERDRLSSMVSSIQSLRNEAELATAESRRELQNSVDKLRMDLQSAERRLEDEAAEHKRATQQRDYERMEAQRRIDDLITARNSAEVKAATADSTRQQLEQRIKDLQNQLQTAEERVAALQPRPESTEEADSASREEELIAQVSELKRKLERKEEDLEAVTAQIAGFQDIAQEAENRLQTFVEAHERLQEQLSLAEQEKDATINDLQQRVNDISSELATSSTELTELRGQHEQETLVLKQEKETLEAEIVRLQNDVADYKAEAENQTQYVKTQADIAERAQKDYEHEFQKHAESMQKLREVRDQYNELQTQITEFKTQAEAARTTLEQSQEHWKSTEGRYEEQLAEAKRRHDDLKQYNQTLLKQFDEYKEQINSLKNDRGASAAAGDAGTAEAGSSNLQDIESYLRREKEILEVQLNLKVQESKRLEQQLAHAQGQLDQTREKLLEEQAKNSGSQNGSSLAHLNKNLEELNVYRESNATLRSENLRLQASFAEKAKALEDLQSELEPLQVRVTELEGELELNSGHLKAVEEDRDRWQKRHQDVLQRYDRIDPKELEDLKKQIEEYKSERDQALEQVNSLNEQLKDATEKLEKAMATKAEEIQAAKEAETKIARDKFNRRHAEKMNEKKAEMAELQKKLDAVQTELATSQTAHADAAVSQEQVAKLQKELEQTRTQLAAAQRDLKSANTARDEALAKAATSAQSVKDAEGGEEGQINEGGNEAITQRLAELEKQLAEAQRKAAEAEQQRSEAVAQLTTLQAQLSAQKNGLQSLQKETAEKDTTITELQQQLLQPQAQDQQPAVNPAPAVDSTIQAEVEKLKNELASKAKEVDDLRAQLNAAKSAERTTEPETSQSNEAVAAIKASLDQRETELKALEASLNIREADLNTRQDLVAKREVKSEDLKVKANKRIAELKKDYESQIATLQETHQAEVERLQQEKQTSDAPAPPVSDGVIPTDDLPRPTVTSNQFALWLRANAAAADVVKTQIGINVKKACVGRDELITKLRQEVEQLNTQKAIDSITAVKQEPEQVKPAEDPETFEMKSKVKDSQLALVRARFAYVEKASKETPTEEVAKVYAIAMTQKPEVKAVAQPATPATPATPAKQDAVQSGGQSQTNTSTPSQPGAQPTVSQQQQSTPIAVNTPQANDANNMPAGQVAQPMPFNQMNQFSQSAGHGIPTNPYPQGNNQMGRGLPQPGFTYPGQMPGQQLPQGQQQPQQYGRGNGLPQPARGALQSNIPRGGSNIPMPGGRGRGQQNQPQPQQQQQAQQPQAQQPQNQNQGQAASQIGRGGGRGAGGRGGRGGQQNQNNNSPRNSLNVNAPGFVPVPGQGGAQQQGGRGQKRSAEDEGDGAATRGGKRARGGRGGGGNAQAGGAE